MPDTAVPESATGRGAVATCLAQAEHACGPLLAAERAMLEALSHGQPADAGGQEIRAALLQFAMLDPTLTAAGPLHAIAIERARFTGPLLLREARCALPLELLACDLPGGIQAYGMTIPRLTIAGGSVGAIEASRAEIHGELAITGDAACEGGLELRGATLGALIFERSRIVGPAPGPDRRPGWLAIWANNLRAGLLHIEDSDIAGEVRLPGCVIEGELSCAGSHLVPSRGDALLLDGCRIGGRLNLARLRASGRVSVQGAEIGLDLDCTQAALHVAAGSAAGCLALSRSAVKGSILLCRGFSATGAVIVRAARIGGDFDCSRQAAFSAPRDALSLSGTEIGGDLKGTQSLRVDGTLRMSGTRVKGQIELFGATLNAAEAWAARGLVAERSVGCLNMNATGTVLLVGAQVGGDLGLSQASLASLDLTGARIAATLDFQKARIEGTLTLDRAQAGVLIDDPGSWPAPGRLSLGGFTFEALGDHAPADAAARLRWIGLQAPPSPHAFGSQPYEQLVAVFRRRGQEDDARQVAIAKQRDLRRSGGLGTLGTLWNLLLDVTVGYGYRQLRPVLLLVVLLLAGTAVFWRARQAHAICPAPHFEAALPNCGVPAGHAPFAPLVYSFELLLPNPDLGQRSDWSLQGGPGTWGFWLYRWIHTLLGWGFAILLALSPTRLLRKD